MLQPETIEQGRDLYVKAHVWILALAEFERTAIDRPPIARKLLVQLAQHLQEWRLWIDTLEKDLASR